MKAYMITEAHKGAILELPKPKPGPGEALIRVWYSGICGSDLHAYEGRHIRRKPPLIPGHECCGMVEAVGTGVHDLKQGDPVTVLPERGCGVCVSCSQGWTNLCTQKTLLGTAVWPGAFAEYITAPVNYALKLPPDLPVKLGVLAEPLAVAVHATRQAGLGPGQSILLFGAGGIGSLIIILARLRGAESITVCDLKQFNLHMARRFGAAIVCNTNGENALDILSRQADFHHVDTTYVAASYHDLINQSFVLTKPKGTVALVGQFNRPGIIDIDKARLKEQCIVSSFTYTRGDFEEAIALLSAHPEKFAPTITAEMPLEETDACLRSMIATEKEAVKIIIHLPPEGA